MAVIAWSPAALADLGRLHSFLANKSQLAADEALEAIRTKTRQLEEFPLSGRVHATLSGRRELVVRFANSGYSVLYSPDEDGIVRIIAVRHMREERY